MAHSLVRSCREAEPVREGWRPDLDVFFTFCLFAVQGPEVNFLLWRTAANQLFVLCKSSGWNPKPLLSILDWRRSRVPTMVEPEVSVQPDGLFSVSMRVNMEAVHGNSTMPKDSKSPDKHSVSGI